MSMRTDIVFNDRASQAAAHFFDSVAYFNTYDGSTEREEGEHMAEALGDKRVLMLRSHGILVGGETIGHAWHNLYLFERACMFQMLAGGQDSLASIPPEVASKVAEYSHTPVWETRFHNLRKILDKREPDYID